jgi:hypothetical protein
VIRFFTVKVLKARAIHAEFESRYGPEALALPTVKKWWRRIHQSRADLFDGPRSGRPFTNSFEREIGSVLNKRPFRSCKMLYRHFRIGKTTCLQTLHDNLDLKRFHLRWVSHTLTINRKSERLSDSKLFLTALMEQKASGFQRIITGDESWFFLYCPRDSVWAASRDELPQRIKQKIDTEKCLVSIL